MQLHREDIELTAPAGSFESLMAAIQGGADSVYFGIGEMNMRARSAMNFKEHDLDRIMQICRHFGKRAYLTLNIVFYNQEIDKLKKTIKSAREKKVDAIIASDQAAIQYAREIGMEVHASTQLNISNTESLKFHSKYIDVAVLARELNLDQIREIKNQIEEQNITGPSGGPIRLEVFAHGAMCMSVSGICYLSLQQHNHSANRGDCLQDCRRSYILKEQDTGRELEVDNHYIMSPGDLCTIHILDKIMDAGVTVLKIEGRARSPEYVRIVSECYDQALKSYFEGTYSREKIENWRKRLSSVYNRGFWEGYYLGREHGEWSGAYGSKASQRKMYIAKNINYFNKIHVADFLCEAGSLKVGDQVYIIGPSTGVIKHQIDEIHVDLKKVEEVTKGERFSFPIQNRIRRSDKLYKIVDVPDQNQTGP
ncbi:MAG: U32 family peptidase [Bacteroidales bacterium]|nr:U32 family peptidase [Bacteroidales bacterium]